MPILPTLFAIFRSVFRSRIALELENLALRQPAQCPETVRQTAAPDACRSLFMGRALARLEKLAIGARRRPARDGHRVAPPGISLVLDLESAPRQTGPAGGYPRSPSHLSFSTSTICCVSMRRKSAQAEGLGVYSLRLRTKMKFWSIDFWSLDLGCRSRRIVLSDRGSFRKGEIEPRPSAGGFK